MSRRSRLFDTLVCLTALTLTALTYQMDHVPRATMWFGLVMSIALYFRRSRPLAVMAVVSLAGLGQVLAFPPTADPLPYDLAIVVAMYSVVKYAKRMRDAYVAGGVVAVGIAIEAFRHPEIGGVELVLWYVACCATVWLAAYTVRNRRLYVIGLEERAATLEREREHLARIAVAEERAAIARELHDIVAHSLAVMIVQADGGRYAMDTEPEQAREALATVAATGREALADMGRLVDVLRGEAPDPTKTDSDPTGTSSEPTGSEPTGTERSPVDLGRVDGLIERARRAGLAVDLARTGDLTGLPPSVELTAFRLLQEGLTNVLRHARRGASVSVTLAREDDELSLSIVDDGGPPEEPPPPVNGNRGRVGHGLIGMRERVAVHHGQFRAGPRLAGGWEIYARIPAETRVNGQARPEVAR